MTSNGTILVIDCGSSAVNYALFADKEFLTEAAKADFREPFRPFRI